MAELHPRFGTPVRAIGLQAGLGCLLLVLGSFDDIVGYFVFVTIAFVALTTLGLYRLPRPGPGEYRVPGYPVTPVGRPQAATGSAPAVADPEIMWRRTPMRHREDVREATRRWVWTALAVLALAGPSSGDDAARRPSDVRFVRLSVLQGLSHDSVFCIFQDHERFLWFGTEEGLNRYDGYSLKVFRNQPADPGSLPNNWIYSLYEDRAHRLWVGTLAGLSLFDRRAETFRRFYNPAAAARGFDQDAVTAILEDRRGRLWIGTVGGGLKRVDPLSGRFVATHRHENGNPASLSHDQVQALYEDKTGRLWVGTREGIDQFDPDRGAFVHYASRPAAPVWRVAEDLQGRLWVATFGAGLRVLDPGKGWRRSYRAHPAKGEGEIPNDWITSVFVDHAGAVWAGTDGSGLLRYDPHGDSFVAFEARARDPTSLSKNVVRSIHEDAQHNLWVGTYMGGVNELQPSPQGFSYYDHDPLTPNSLGGEGVQSFLEDGDANLWVGTQESGLDRLDRRSETFSHFRHDPQNPRSLSRDIVTALHQDRAGRIWVGTHGGGLSRFDAKTGAFTSYRPRSATEDPGGEYVWALAEDPAGALWVGTNDGVERFDPATGRFTSYPHDPADEGSLGDVNVRALVVQANGDVWVGTLGGLDLLRSGASKFVHFRSRPGDPRSLSKDTIASLHLGSHGKLWIGTLGGGLNAVDVNKPDAFTAYRSADGLPSDSVYCVVEDDAGQIWLGTSRGLARLDPGAKKVKSFGLSNGLHSLQFNLGACRKTREGRLLFGSSNGFYSLDPRTVVTTTYAPPVQFTSVRILDRPVAPGFRMGPAPEARLAYRQNMVSAEFAALDFTVPRGNEYAYTLEGFREGWTSLGSRHDVTFTNLHPGGYTLRVRASNSDGVWSDPAASLRILVAPPFWATWWFRVLGLASLGAALFGLHRLRVLQLVRREEDLTRRVDEALARVKVLRGLLPICAWCKKVRDDGGYWNQIEAYLTEHSEADFSHGICPECAARLRPASQH